MKCTKAIEILEVLCTSLPQYPPEDRLDAINLAINCLKFYSKLAASNKGELSGNYIGEDREDA